jgi:Ca2+-binding RTX toxin-like protein
MRKTILVLTSVALAMLVAGGVAWAATVQCPLDRFICQGTNKADTMFGNNKSNVIYGRNGGDTMYGRGNADGLRGGPRSDKLYGDRGVDRLFGNGGSDKLYGGIGNDEMWSAGYGNGRDLSDDYIRGGAGNDVLFATHDRYSNNYAVLTNYLQRGVDRVYGDDGWDDIWVVGNAAVGDSAKEIVDCGPGIDKVIFDEGVDIVNDTCEEKEPH